MDEDARLPSSLKGRLADVFVPALVDGQLDALSRRLGNRATVDDPIYGRASSLASLDPLIGKIAAWCAERCAVYSHVYSTTGVDRDAAEGMLTVVVDGARQELPIVVVAERRRLREVELRLYHGGKASDGRKARAPLVAGGGGPPLPAIVKAALVAMKEGAIDSALAAFEEGAQVVDAQGRRYPRIDGALANWLGESALSCATAGLADDGRCCCIEVTIERGSGEGLAAVLAFQRGESGLVRELRIYSDV